MLEKVKMVLRLTTDSFDDELKILIGSAKKDLGMANVDFLTESDPMIIRAVCTYCRLYWGQPEDYERLKMAYDELKSQLGMSSGYTDYVEQEHTDCAYCGNSDI